MLLLDASVLLAAEDSDDEHHAAAVKLLRSAAPLATLDLAFFETANVAVRAWRDLPAADRLRRRIDAVAEDGGIVRVDSELISEATAIADAEGLSAYGAAYVAAARRLGAQLVSCDVRDLVSRGLAVLPDAAGSEDG